MKHFIQIICLLDYDFVFESHDARHYKTETMRELDEKFGNYYIFDVSCSNYKVPVHRE